MVASGRPVNDLRKAWRSPELRREAFLSVPGNLDVDGSVMFRALQARLVPEVCGVYLVHDLRGVLYVGRSVDLQRRFEEHRLQKANPFLALALGSPFGDMRFSWIATPDEAEADRLERELISWLQPACNRLVPTPL
ncbi:GIY-YIG nuclease family protein [Erythrobacter sp.]|uniref:GIY-YIG nuclease family protein n=1 Tax=Erythrobacter sp. TaxID=1042 RepID=UPI001B068532|nr:GIY-YIG nuclease family protein [Erythrobacter sp.]MBO6528041.1 GIY-YIG nuclease family protein [Erythrobacter sp.]MBO6531296.1 GIY-YIG nuclease family protein [Erythrobacter sp.]